MSYWSSIPSILGDLQGLGEACEGRRAASGGWRHTALPEPTIGALASLNGAQGGPWGGAVAQIILG